MYYEIHGQGEPLVVINGLSSDASELRTVTLELARHNKVILFDNRGVGRTDKPKEPYTIEMMAEDTYGLVRAIGFKSANVAGISMGGLIALELTLSHPEVVERLILISTGARYIRQPWVPLAGLLRNLPLFRSKYPQPNYAFRNQRLAIQQYNCLARLSEIDKPTLILHGKRDKIAPPILANELHGGIKGSRLQTFKGGLLFFLIRSRRPFLSSVEKFLS